MSEWKKLSFKDKMDILEAVCTIVVSLMALWGSIVAWENGFWHKLKHVIDYSHEKIVAEESKLEKDL